MSELRRLQFQLRPSGNPNPGPAQGDKARLSELKRVEIERGADSPGVKLGIFPAPTGPLGSSLGPFTAGPV